MQSETLEKCVAKFERIAKIIDRNLYHQREKVEDAKSIAMAMVDELRRSETALSTDAEPVKPLHGNDAVWARFYRDGKNLGEICSEFNCGVYDLSPWLTAPLVRSALSAQVQDVAGGVVLTQWERNKLWEHAAGVHMQYAAHGERLTDAEKGTMRKWEALGVKLAAAPAAKQEGKP